MALTVVTFLTCALIVVLAGIMLARNADVIAARTRLGGLWVGSVFLAIATSLPELTTDLSAVRLGAPDLAAGDLFGSSMANMLILALVSLVPQGRLLFRKAALDHALYAALAIIMTCVAAIFVLFRPAVSIAGVGPGSILLLVTYIIGSRAIFRHSSLAQEAGRMTEMSPPEAGSQTLEPEARSLRPAVFTFVAAAVVILIVAPVFARMAARLAQATGLGDTFFGTWFVGMATSLPELVTSLAAVRMQAYDLAVGNLFGSNALNMAMFVPLDLAHSDVPILTVVGSTHALSALISIVLMGTALAALVYRSKRRLAMLEPGSAVMVIIYFAGLFLIYLQSVAQGGI